jgi:hypothetical protein
MVALAVLHKDRDKKPILYALLNALLMQTHLQVEGFVLGIGLVYLIETIADFKEKKPVKKRLIGLAIMFASGLLLIAELYLALQTNTDIEREGIMLGNLKEYVTWYITPLVFILFFCIFTKTDWKCNLIQAFNIGWTFFMVVFIYYANCQRVCLLSVSVLFSLINMKPFEKNGYWKYIPALFGISVFCSVTLLSDAVSDIFETYSYARDTAAYIEEHFNSETDVVIPLQKAQYATISVWLKDKELFYDPIGKAPANFADLGAQYLFTRDIDDILEDDFVKGKNVYLLYADYSDDWMIISSINNFGDLEKRVELVASFTGSYRHEDFELYKFVE